MAADPTIASIQNLLTTVTDPSEREVLFRIQAEINTGARHNDHDLSRYSAMTHLISEDTTRPESPPKVEAA